MRTPGAPGPWSGIWTRRWAWTPFEGIRPISEWMPEILEILVRVYGRDLWIGARASVRRMVDALDHIKGAATRLATLPGELDARVEAPEVLAILLAELTGPEMTIPPDPEDHAVELLGWLELPLDDAPAVILTGVNERILPEALGADPFLPGALRTRLEISRMTAPGMPGMPTSSRPSSTPGRRFTWWRAGPPSRGTPSAEPASLCRHPGGGGEAASAVSGG